MKKKKYIIFDDTINKNKHNNNIKKKNNIENIAQENINITGIKSYDSTNYHKHNENIAQENITTNINENITTNKNENMSANINLTNNNINSIDGNSIDNSENVSNTIHKDNNVYLKELIKKQNKNVSNDKKLDYNDIKRISKFLSSSIFDKNICSIWNGYITNEKNQSKGTYVNFYFNKKKIALHRLLYINYVEDVSDNEYIKFSCLNKGKCCNINHMKKYMYNKNINESTIENKKSNDDINKEKKSDAKSSNEHISINIQKNKLIVEL